MAIEEAPRLGRRSILAAAAGAAAALAGAAVAAPSRALAADHDPLKIGEANSGTITTVLDSPSDPAFKGTSGGGDGLVGGSSAANKSGLYAYSTHATGNGVFGRNLANGNYGAVGGSEDSVRGHCTKNGRAGVSGTTEHAGGYGVTAQNTVQHTSVALAGVAAVWAVAQSTKYGLAVAGKTWFERSGVVTVAAGKKTAKVPSIALTDKSYVFATMQYPRSGVYIAAALPNVDTDSITIYLNKAVSYATKVAWFVIDKETI